MTEREKNKPLFAVVWCNSCLETSIVDMYDEDDEGHPICPACKGGGLYVYTAIVSAKDISELALDTRQVIAECVDCEGFCKYL